MVFSSEGRSMIGHAWSRVGFTPAVVMLLLAVAAAPGCKKGKTRTVTILGSAPTGVAPGKTILVRTVEIPATAEEARKLHAPPRTTVKLETVTPKERATSTRCAGGGAGALICTALQILPLRPLVQQIAVIESPGRLIQAAYTEDGMLLETARITVGDEIQLVEGLASTRLNRRFIVETGRRPAKSKETESEPRPTSILKQVPELRALYLAAFEEDQRTPPNSGGALRKTVTSAVRFTCTDLSRVLGAADRVVLGRELLENPKLTSEVKGLIRSELNL
jgi:hypothetical protein